MERRIAGYALCPPTAVRPCPTHYSVSCFKANFTDVQTGGISVNVGAMQTKLVDGQKRTNSDIRRLCSICSTTGLSRPPKHTFNQNAGTRRQSTACHEALRGNLEGNLKRLREDLKAGRLEPPPVDERTVGKLTRVSDEMRPLGIPAISGRLVQEALRRS